MLSQRLRLAPWGHWKLLLCVPPCILTLDVAGPQDLSPCLSHLLKDSPVPEAGLVVQDENEARWPREAMEYGFFEAGGLCDCASFMPLLMPPSGPFPKMPLLRR